MAEILFWTSALMILQTYVFYPLTVALLRGRRGTPAPAGTSFEPAVSVVIAVHNEKDCVRERVENIFSGSYPADKTELLVGSDASTDGTNEILGSISAPGYRFFAFPGRRGKAGVLNDLLREAGGDIIVFSDANTVFRPDTIAELVRPFADTSVGAVTGELILQSGDGSVGGEGEVSYWRFENWLKHAESDAGSTLGASGGVYAIRRELWRPLPYEKSIVDDFVIPMNVLKAGRVVKYSRTARAFEKAAGSVRGEFARKVRIGASNFNGIPEFVELLHPRYGFVAFALWSHKILRWFVPFFLIAVTGAAIALRDAGPFYALVIRLITLFGGAALAGMVADTLRWRIGVLGYPYYFLAMNFALFLGFFKSLAGRQAPDWKSVR